MRVTPIIKLKLIGLRNVLVLNSLHNLRVDVMGKLR